MSDEQNINEQEEQQPDQLSIFKQDIDKKFSSHEEKFNQLLQSQQELLSSLNQNLSTKHSVAEASNDEDLTSLLLSDPDKALKKLRETIKKEIQSDFQRQSEQSNKQNQRLMQLQSEYPELRDLDHPLTKKALDIYDRMSNEDKSHPLAYEVAINKAAIKVGLKPKSERSSDNDDNFSLSGKGKGGAKSPKLPPAMMEFAAKVGLDVNDPKVIERLRKRAGL